jgi:hypothetical protein
VLVTERPSSGARLGAVAAAMRGNLPSTAATSSTPAAAAAAGDLTSANGAGLQGR